MIITPDLGHHGRIGNTLFQYASAKALALERNVELKLPSDLDTRKHHGQQCKLNCFKISDSKFTQEEYNNIQFSYNLPNDHQNKLYGDFWNIPGNAKIYGAFESEYYFNKHKHAIIAELQFKESYESYSTTYIANIRSKYPDYEIVAIHIRRNIDDILVKSSKQRNIEFIENIINKHFNGKYIFLIFCGGSRDNTNTEDIQIYKQYFPSDRFIFCEINDVIREMCIMKNCDHAIGYEYSTFFWWATYLNSNPNKKIIVNTKSELTVYDPNIFWPEEYIKY